MIYRRRRIVGGDTSLIYVVVGTNRNVGYRGRAVASGLPLPCHRLPLPSYPMPCPPRRGYRRGYAKSNQIQPSSTQFCQVKVKSSARHHLQPSPPEPKKDSPSTPPIRRVHRFRLPIHQATTDVRSPLITTFSTTTQRFTVGITLFSRFSCPACSLSSHRPASCLGLYRASDLTRAPSVAELSIQAPDPAPNPVSLLGPPLRFSIPPTTVHHPFYLNRPTSQNGRFKPAWITVD